MGEPKKQFSYTWFIIDNLFATFIIGPLVVFYWRGTWTLMNLHMYPDKPWLSAWICVAFGNGGLFILALLQEPLKKYLKQDNWVVWMLGYHTYSYIASFFSVCHWRGTWASLDYFTGRDWVSHTVTLFIGLGLLWFLRSSKMVAAPPLLVAIDRHPDFFVFSSRFARTTANMEHYVLDHVLTVGVVWQGVVLVWRGFWGLGDNLFYPDELDKSSWASLGVGFGIMLLCIPLQLGCNAIYKLSAKRGWHKLVRVLVEDVVFLIGNFGVVHHWRGVWVALDVYVLPDNQSLSSWITHAAGIGGLMLLLAGNCNLTRGCVVTGDAPPDIGCFFDNEYFRYFLSKPLPKTEDNGTKETQWESKPDGHCNPAYTAEVPTVEGEDAVVYDQQKERPEDVTRF